MIKRITSLFITLILLFQCIPLAYADEDIDANAAGNGNTSVQTGSGDTWGYSKSGLRITILDTTGRPASNSVDLLFSTSINAKIWCWNSKVESLKITKGERLNTRIPVDVVVNDIESPQLPHPMTWSGGPVAQGTAVREWMLGNEITLSKGSGYQRAQYEKAYSNAIKTIKESKKSQIDYTDVFDNLAKSFEKSLVDFVNDFYVTGYMDSITAQKDMCTKKNKVISELRNTGVYTEKQLSELGKKLSGVIKTVYEKYINYNSASNHNSTSNKASFKEQQMNNLDKKTSAVNKASLDNLFMIAYAANNTQNEKPAWIKKLLNYEVEGKPIFIFKNKAIAEDEDAISNTVSKNHFKILVEPIVWVKANNGDRIYGTITNINEYFYTNGKYSNIVSGVGAIVNKVGPYSLSLEHDEVFTDLTFKAPPTNTYVAGKGLEISAKKFTEESSASANPIIGYAMHCYSLNHADEGFTHTWDWEKCPIGKPGNAPEYIPDSTTGSKVKQVSRIVKVYEIETDEGIEHLETFERVNTVSIIQIEDEPQYRLIEWRYGTPNNPVDWDTTWDEAINNVPSTNSGTKEAEVDIKNKENPDQTTTLYVRLRLPLTDDIETPIIIPGDVDTDTAIITESQITKALSTENPLKDKSGTDLTNWGDYKFVIKAPPKGETADGHIKYYCHSYPTLSGTVYVPYDTRTDSPGESDIQERVRRLSVADSSKGFEIEDKTGSNDVFKAWTRTNETYKLNFSILKQTASDVNNEVIFNINQNSSTDSGVSYLTNLWRCGTIQSSKIDNVYVAGYKRNQMDASTRQKVESILEYKYSDPANRKSTTVKPFNIDFGFTKDDTAELYETNYTDYNMTHYSSAHTGYHSASTASQPVAYETSDINFKANVTVETYSGQAKSLSSKDVATLRNFSSDLANTNLDSSIHYVRKCNGQISFYPYIRMSFQETKDAQNDSGYKQSNINALKAVELTPGGSGTNSDKQNKQNYLATRTTFVLSDKKSSILPTNAVEVSWESSMDRTGTAKTPGLKLTSQQWSTHARVTSGAEAWNKANSVLPGGAIYFIDTQGTESSIETVTYSTLLDNTQLGAWVSAGSNEYTISTVAKNNIEYFKQFRDIMDNMNIVQWVNKDYNLANAWDNGTTGLIVDKGVSLNKLGLNNKTNTDNKYYLLKGTVNGTDISKEADLDIIGEAYKTDIFKVFSDTEGNIWVADITAKNTVNMISETDLSKLIDTVKGVSENTNGTIQSPNNSDMIANKQVKLIGTRDESLPTIIERLKAKHQDIYRLELKTGIISNMVNSVTRGAGNDVNAAWVKDGKWYNEAFDGIYVVRQQGILKLGFGSTNKRTSVLDPNLCPAKSSKGDTFTTAFISQFRLASKSESTYAAGQDNGYCGTFDGIKVYIPNLENMMVSRPFYIPNGTVQDLG